MLEFFAGAGHIASSANAAGFRSAALDIEDDFVRAETRRTRLDKRSPFDVNSASGFASLV